MRFPDRFQHVEGWQEQFRRVERWQSRILQHLQTQNGMLGRDGFDLVYAFFQASHHLRDWMLNANAATMAELDALLAGCFELQLGEDISNNSKHYVRNGKVRVSSLLGFQREYRFVSGRPGVRWWVLWTDSNGDQDRFDLVDLVAGCVMAWRNFCSPRLNQSAGRP